MSDPVLLIVTSETSSQCSKLIERKTEINAAVKVAYPNIRCFWLSIDNIDLSGFLPGGINVPYVPMFVFLPIPTLLSYLNGDYSVMPNIMSMQKYEGYTTQCITSWLRETIDPSVKSNRSQGRSQEQAKTQTQNQCPPPRTNQTEKIKPLFEDHKSSKTIQFKGKYNGVMFSITYDLNTGTLSCLINMGELVG